MLKDKHKRVLEAVKEGLLQVHGTALNTKQQGIFRLMEENFNSFNNRIGWNNKIAKALDIKEELNIDCLMYCEYRISFRHKTTRTNLSRCSSRNWHAEPSLHTMSMKINMQEGFRKLAPALSALEIAQVTSRRSAEMTRAWADGVGYSWEGQNSITHTS